MRAILRRLFLEHPASVGEGYIEHGAHAAGFGAALLRAAIASFLHAAIPGLCMSTGSRIVSRLHDRMILNRRKVRMCASAPPDDLAEHI
jgi:hypothetical protein